MISIIIPVYNGEKTIGRMLESILGQTCSDFEVVIVNDGSTDLTQHICMEYIQKDKRIKLVNQKNSGVSSARNSGLRAASGSYIYFADSDDYLDQKALEVMMREIGDADMLLFDYYQENSRGHMKCVHLFSPERIEAKEKETCEKMVLCGGGQVCSKFCRKEAIERSKEGFFSEEISMCEDLVFFYTIAQECSKIIYVQTPLYYYTYNEKSLCNKKFSNENMTFMSAYKKIEEQCVKNRRCVNEIVYLYLNNIANHVNKVLRDKRLGSQEQKRFLRSLRMEYDRIAKDYDIVFKHIFYHFMWKINVRLADAIFELRRLTHQ